MTYFTAKTCTIWTCCLFRLWVLLYPNFIKPRLPRGIKRGVVKCYNLTQKLDLYMYTFSIFNFPSLHYYTYICVQWFNPYYLAISAFSLPFGRHSKLLEFLLSISRNSKFAVTVCLFSVSCFKVLFVCSSLPFQSSRYCLPVSSDVHWIKDSSLICWNFHEIPISRQLKNFL